jgi:hypothetical protein
MDCTPPHAEEDRTHGGIERPGIRFVVERHEDSL